MWSVQSTIVNDFWEDKVDHVSGVRCNWIDPVSWTTSGQQSTRLFIHSESFSCCLHSPEHLWSSSHPHSPVSRHAGWTVLQDPSSPVRSVWGTAMVCDQDCVLPSTRGSFDQLYERFLRPVGWKMRMREWLDMNRSNTEIFVLSFVIWVMKWNAVLLHFQAVR